MVGTILIAVFGYVAAIFCFGAAAFACRRPKNRPPETGEEAALRLAAILILLLLSIGLAAATHHLTGV